MKLIAGTFTARPGRCAAYLAAARDHLERSRLDPDCLWIELVPMPDHPDRMLLAEAFTIPRAALGTQLILHHKTCGPIRGDDRRPHHPRSG